MITLKHAIELANQYFQKQNDEFMKSRKIIAAVELKNGWWLSFDDDTEWGGLLFVVKKTGKVLWGNPPPIEFIEKDENPREVPDKEFMESSVC